MLVASLTKPHFLNTALEKFKRQHPQKTPQQAMKELIKYHVPGTVPGSPAWHKNHLSDLLCMVEQEEMPSFFHTLTSDEMSNMRWPEFVDVEKILNETPGHFEWKVSGATFILE